MHKPFIKSAVDSAVKIMVESYEDGTIDIEIGDAIFTVQYKKEIHGNKYDEYYTCISVQDVVCACGDRSYTNVVNAIWNYFEALKKEVYPS